MWWVQTSGGEGWSFSGGWDEGSTGTPCSGKHEDNYWYHIGLIALGVSFFTIKKKNTDNSSDMNGTFQGEMEKTNSECEYSCLVMMRRVCFLIVKGGVEQWGTYRITRTKPSYFRNESKRRVRKRIRVVFLLLVCLVFCWVFLLAVSLARPHSRCDTVRV